MKFANSNPDKIKDDSSKLAHDIELILRNSLRTLDCLRIAFGRPASKIMEHGLHQHEDWELFLAIRGSMRYVVAGQPEDSLPKGSVLIVPPDCLHTASHLPQKKDLRVLVLHIPRLGSSGSCGALGVDGKKTGFYSVLSVGQFARWSELIGEAPGSVMDKILRFQSSNVWGKHHAVALLRLLVASYAEMSASIQDGEESGDRRVHHALHIMQSRYCESRLTLPQIADTVGLSISRLSSLFREMTGQSVQQTLIDIRLRRAMTLIRQSEYSIKEIADLTGWSNQLYFSAAFKKKYGHPPSYFKSSDSK